MKINKVKLYQGFNIISITKTIAIVVPIAAITLALAAYSNYYSTTNQQPAHPGTTPPGATINNGIVQIPEKPSSASPPMPFSILVNGKNDTSIVATIPQGQSRIINVVINPSLVGIDGEIYTQSAFPLCNEVQGSNTKCLSESLSATLSQTHLPRSTADLTPTLLQMNITAPNDIPPGQYSYEVIADTNKLYAA